MKSKAMELKVNIEFRELMKLIRQLPRKERDQLQKELAAKSFEDVQEKDHKGFRDFLKTGPVMTDEQFQRFQEHRTAFRQWRSS